MELVAGQIPGHSTGHRARTRRNPQWFSDGQEQATKRVMGSGYPGERHVPGSAEQMSHAP